MYSPSALVVVSRVPRVAVFVAVTLAPGIGAPDASVTVPVMLVSRTAAVVVWTAVGVGLYLLPLRHPVPVARPAAEAGLAPYARPQQWFTVTEFPLDRNGKVDLRALAATPSTPDAAARPGLSGGKVSIAAWIAGTSSGDRSSLLSSS